MSSGDSLFHINHEKYDYIEKISDNNNADSRMNSVTFQNGDNNDSNVSWDEDYSRRKAIFMENTKALLSKRNYSSATDNMTTNTRDIKYSESPTHALLELEENLIQLDKNKRYEDSSRNSMISLKDDSSINNIDDNKDPSTTDNNNNKVNKSYYCINKSSNSNNNVCTKQKMSFNNNKTHQTNIKESTKSKTSLKNRKVHHINKEFELPSLSVSPHLNNSSKISSLVAKKMMFTKNKVNNNSPITFDTSEKSTTNENIDKNTNNKNTNNKSLFYPRKCKYQQNNDNKINYSAFKSDTKSRLTLTKSIKSDTNFGEDMSLFLSISSNGANENNNEESLLYNDNGYADEAEGDADKEEEENGKDYLETVSIHNMDLFNSNNVTNCGDNSLESNISVKNIKLNIRDKSTANHVQQLNKSKRLVRDSRSHNKKGHNSLNNISYVKAGNSNKTASREESKENKTESVDEKPKLKYISKKYNWADGLKIDELEVELDKVKRELKLKNEKICQLESQLDKTNKNDVIKSDILGSKFTNNNTNEGVENDKSNKMYQYKQTDNSNHKTQNSRVGSNENLSSIKDYNPNSATVLKNRIKDLESQIQDLQEANDVASKFITSFKDKVVNESHLDSNKIISELILKNKNLKEMVDNLKQSLPNETRNDMPSSKFLRHELDNLKEDLLNLRHQNQMIVMENLKLKQQLKSKDESYRASELENDNFYKSNSLTKPTELIDHRNDSYTYDSEEVMDSNFKYPDYNSKKSISGNNCNTKDIQPLNIVAEISKYNPRTVVRQNEYNYSHQSQIAHPTMFYNDNVDNNTNTNGINHIITNNIPNKERHLTRSDLTINQTSGQQRSDLIGRMNNDNCSTFNDSHHRNLFANDYAVTDDQSSPAVSSSSNHSQSTDDILREVQQGIPELSRLQEMDNCPDQYSTHSQDISKFSKIHSDLGLMITNKPSSIQQSSFSTLHRTAIAPKSGSDVTIGDIIKFIRQGGRISKGLVHFIGNLPRRNDIYIGVELELEDGKHDGVYEGVRYFKCKPNKGVFVAFNKVIMVYSKRHDFC